MESSTTSSGIGRSVGVTNQRRPMQRIKIENPFAFKVLQVFTGFGIGCGVGIGVGQPINLGALPMVNQVMSATRGATDAFSGVSRHANDALRKLGAKNIQAGIGCGVGFGHGFGLVGVAVKPGVIQKIQASLVELAMKMMTKLGIGSNTSIASGALPMSFPSGMSVSNESSMQNPLGGVTQLAAKLPEQTFQPGFGNLSLHPNENLASTSNLLDVPFAGRTEKVITSFLQNPIIKEDVSDINESAGRLRSENNVLQMVLKHQQVIEELMEENEKLRQILIEDLKISPKKLQASYSTRNKSPCSDCFECRRKQRKR